MLLLFLEILRPAGFLAGEVDRLLPFAQAAREFLVVDLIAVTLLGLVLVAQRLQFVAHPVQCVVATFVEALDIGAPVVRLLRAEEIDFLLPLGRLGFFIFGLEEFAQGFPDALSGRVPGKLRLQRFPLLEVEGLHLVDVSGRELFGLLSDRRLSPFPPRLPS